MAEQGDMFMGIDGGGTGCRALLCDATGRRLGKGHSGAANILHHVNEARQHILEASHQALKEAGYRQDALSEVSAFLGLAGAQVGDGASRLKATLPFKTCMIETDAITSLEGALGSNDGAVALIGTGSAFIYQVGGVVRTAGGWGLVVSDHASGARLGRCLLEEALLCHDGIRPTSPLTTKVLQDFAYDPAAIVAHAEQARPADFAALAPLLFDYLRRGDPIAGKIIGAALADIEETLRAIAEKGADRFCMLGGLGRLYADRLAPDLRTRLCEPLDDAVGGALSLALKHLSPSRPAVGGGVRGGG